MEGPSGASNSGGGFRRSRGVNWTEEETEQLLEAWSDRDVQLLLENGPHNRQAFERVSFNLAQHQMDKTPSQCREKIKKLKTIYRNLNNHGKVSRKIRGKLIHKLHQVMGGISVVPPSNEKNTDMSIAVNQEEEMDGAEVDGQRTNNVLGDEFGGNNFGIPVKIIAMDSGGDFLDEDDSSVSSDQESMSSSDIDHAEVTTQTPVSKIRVRSKKSSRRRKRSRSKKLSAIYLLIDKVIAAQSAANERFAALEERRLLLDKELEEKRIEAEAHRQEAQRQHEIRLLSMMSQQMACVLKYKLMKIHGWTDSCPKVSRLFASADKVERRRKRTAVLTVCACSVSLSLPWDSRVFTRETRMELNSCSSQDDTSAVFVRDWRLRKITTVNNNLANQDTAPIVRTRTVITIGSVNELDGPALQQDDQTISASEVGETACGRISITVKTIPKSPSIRVIPKENPIFSPTLHAEEEWTLRDTVPFKSSSVSDPSWIYVPSQPDRSKILQRPPWQEYKLSRDIDSALADNQQLCRTLSNKKSSYTLTEIDMSPSVDSRKVNSDHGITNKVLDSPKIHLKPTFRMTFGDETKILRLTDTSSSEKNVRKVEKASSTARSPIGYHEWLKSLDRLEGESYPNQIHSSDDEKVKHQDTKSIKSIDRTPVGTAHKSSDINQPVGFVETSPSKSILKSVQNESDIRPETVNLVQNQLHKDVAATIVHEVSSVVCKSSLTKPINSLIDTKDVQDCTDRKSSSRLVGWVPKSNNTDSKFNKIVPTNGNQLAVAPKMVDCTTNPLATAMKADRANNVEVVNKNQINSMKSLSSSGSWKNNSNTQDGMNGPALSSGMDLSKATELVKQFFNTGNDEETDNNPSDSLTTDKQPLNVTKSNLLAEDPTLSTISHQSAATLPTSNGSPKFQPESVQDQRYDANHHRGRPAIKSKIPLRIPRPASSSACSHSVNNSTLTAPSVAYVDKGNHIPSSRNCAFNKAKSSLNMPSKIKPPSTGSAVRTRSVENLRQTSPLSSYVLYSNIMTARDDGTSHHHYQ